ncbi:MAG TPA: arginine deiminase-related protein [Arachidicoccus sp.]|nr:arginine deiminase-related protein [Arachidicoccus sp.]
MPQLASSVLMVRPAAFGFNTETAANNVFQQKISAGQEALSSQAIQEFDRYVQTLREHKIDVCVIEDSAVPVKPDAIFPNNWFCTMPDGKIIVFPMFAPNRREEKRDAILLQLSHDFKVTDVEDWSEYEAENFFLEGTGSMIFDHENKTVYACISARTHNSLLDTFARSHGYRVVSFHAKDENGAPIYHTNVMMHIGDTYCVICLDSIQDEAQRIRVSQELSAAGHEIIPISLAQVRAFAGNMLQVKNSEGEKFTLLSQKAFESLTGEQKDILGIHTRLLPMAIPTIETIGGGSARCMVAEIFLERK